MMIRTMNIDDYEKVYALWMSCKNMGFNNLDDSRQGIGRKLVEKSLSVLKEEGINKVALLVFIGRRKWQLRLHSENGL